MNGRYYLYNHMSDPSISPLPLLILLILLPLSSPWCYKSFFPIQGQASIIDVSPDNTYMAITSISQNLVQVYDLTTNNLLLNYTPPAGTVASAKFTRDGTYLGVGVSNGLVHLLSGRPTFNTTIINNVTTTNTIVDIDFNINNNKMVVCYSNTGKFDIINNYTGNGLPVTPVTTTNNIVRCKFSQNDDVGLIDNNKLIRIYRNSTSAFSTSITSNANFKNFDIRPTTATPIKFIAVGNDTKSYYGVDAGSLTVNSYTFSSFLSGGTMSAACYSGNALYYAFAGNSNDARVYIFNENNTLSNVFNDFTNPSNYQPSTCRFANDGSYLYVGSTANNNLAYIYIYKDNCFECPLGYYLTSSTSCSLCSNGANMSLCLSCNNATSCTSCIVGYYLNQTNKQCYKCDYAMEGCSTCGNQATCYECNFHYFLNKTSKLCQTCSSVITGCLICNGTSNSTCLSCSQQYYLFNGSCVRCNNTKANCLKCSSNTTCLQCLFGFYANSTGTCVSCNTNCTSCYNSAANCSTCARGFYVSNYVCTPCSTFCMQCNNTNYCFDCQAGTYLTATGTCTVCAAPCDSCNSTGCLNCIAGFYLSGTTCSYCSTNCTSCLNSTNCSTCAFGSYLTSSNLCLSCSSLFSGCSSCNLTQCFSCVASNYLNASNICVSCITGGCLVCNSSSTCQACAIGYYLTATFSCSTCAVTCESCSGASTTCTSCIPGTYLSGNLCLYCASNCQSCNGTACFSCNIGYYLSSGSCSTCSSQIYGCTDCLNGTYCTSCQLGKYLNSTNLCSECSSNCGSCNSTTCLSCNIGYYLNSSNSCVKCMNNCSECYSPTSCFSCNPGFYLNGAVCASCWGVSRGCLTCNTTFCFNCQIGYYLNSSNLCNNCQATITNCLYCLSSSSCQTCAQGYYLNAAATACTSCISAIDGCQSCINSTNCLSCAIGYYLNGNSCSTCASKCMTCNSTGCITCAFRYSYNSSDCLTCSSLIQYCQICSNSTTCLRCFQGFYLSSGSCISCQSNLVGCSYCNSSAICTSCMSGYYLNGNTCTICSSTEGCKLCSSSSNCSLCTTGYALSSTTCVTCSSLLTNCVYCANSTACTQCSGGYYVNGLTCSKCTSISSGCILCSNGTQCLQCQGGYYLNGLVCSACSVQGCQLCTALLPTQCINCYTGYYLSGTSCLSCNISGCIDCNQSNTCVSCQLGYYLDASSTCSLCSAISGCSKCSSSTVCTECQTLYYLSGNTCTPCSNTLSGCAFCTNSSSCLSCNSGYYLNSSLLCSVCTSLTGCLLCTDMSTCTYCNSGYYLSAGTCYTCTNISQCAQCINATTCSACISGYALSSGTCAVITGSSGGSSSGSASPTVKNLKLKSYYVSPTTLKHVLLAVGMTYKQVSASWTTDVKLYVGNKNTTTLLTIQSVQWGKANQLIFYTNNPLNLNVKSLHFVNRLLIGQTVAVNMDSSAQISQPLLASILPNLLADSSLTLGYSLDDPEFYNSYISSVYNTYYYIVGIVVTCVLFFNFLMKALCTVTHSNNHGYIMGHIFALKTVSISLYPTYGEYINYSYGYMTADLPYINKWVGELLSDSSDDTPLGYLLFYTNMSMFSMFLLALFVYLMAVGINYLCFNEGGSSKFKLEKNSQYLKRKEYSRFKAVNQFLTNFFYFGLTFAGCASLQGSILNPYNIISLNGVGYVIGIIVYMTMLGQCFNSAYNQWNFERLRLFVKATMLSLAHFNPIYILVVVLTLDVSLFIVQAKLKQKYIVNFKLFIVNQILVNFALAFIYYLPDSLLAIYISAAAVSLAVIIEIFMHYLQKKIHIKDYPFFSKEQILSSDKSLPSEDVNWKLNLQDYTLEKQVNTRTNIMGKDLHEDSHSNPLMATQDISQQMITKTTNFREQAPQQSPEKKDRRARRFRDANKNRNTVLNSSWTSFDMNSSF